jgi:hypothetical protein
MRTIITFVVAMFCGAMTNSFLEGMAMFAFILFVYVGLCYAFGRKPAL